MLVEAIEKYRAGMDALYNHNDVTRHAVIQHFGIHHPIAEMNEFLNATPSQTADQVLRWHAEWMRSQPTFGVWHQGETDDESDFFLGDVVDAEDCAHCIRLVAIPPLLKESKE